MRAVRKALGVKPTFKSVDTCAAEFAAHTPYYYKTYEDEDEVAPCDRPKAMILGAGPNRIGQGIEFDYCCVHAAYALSDAGYETIMVNCNPETVSTDYDTSDRLYFEPLTFEDVMDIVDAENPAGVVVTFGGQTPLKLAHALEQAGVPDHGHARLRPSTSPRTAGASRRSSTSWASRTRLQAPPTASTRRSRSRAASASRCSCGPSYVLGGRGMVIAYNEQYLEKYMAEAVSISPEHPVLLDRFLEGAVEVDVDAVCDGETVYIGGVMEHIEEAGIHSGDSACSIPPYTLSEDIVERIREHSSRARDAPWRARSHERAVRGEGPARLRARGQPAGEPHRAVREQGHRRAARQGRGARHGGSEARRDGPARRRPRARALLRQGGGHAVRALPGRRLGARARR